MNKHDREFKQDLVNCPLCGDISKYSYLACMGNANFRTYECVGNKKHICFIDEDVFWSKTA